MPQMRTIESAYREIKENDPQSCITKNALRTLVVSGGIPSVKVGAKYLVDLEAVQLYFGQKADTAICQ